MNRRGFTIVELIIAISIMAVLLVLGVVNLRGTQVQARDDERKADIQTLTQNLESFYSNGNVAFNQTVGQYPSNGLLDNIRYCKTPAVPLNDAQCTNTAVPGAITKMLPDLDLKAVVAPGKSTAAANLYTSITESLFMSTTTTQPASSDINNTTRHYVYQPLYLNTATGVWSVCTGTQECRKFNLYYKLEATDTVVKVTSKNQ